MKQDIRPELLGQNGYVSNPDLSFANNVMHAAAMPGIADSPVSRSAKPSGNLRQQDSRIIDDVIVGSSTYGVLSGRGLSGFGLASQLLKPIDVVPEKYNSILTWYPVDDKTLNKRTALAQWPRQGVEAAKYVMKMTNPTMAIWEPDKQSQGIHYALFSLAGCDECKPDGSIGVSVSWVSADAPTVLAPDFAGGAAAHYIKSSFYYAPHRNPETGVRPDNRLDIAFYRAFSSELPSWAYIYLAPNKYLVKTPKGENVPGQQPLILHNGEIHFFQQPSEEQFARSR
jgi:hypothetical protein